eukprot:809408-Amphidinium_carterae.1
MSFLLVRTWKEWTVNVCDGHSLHGDWHMARDVGFECVRYTTPRLRCTGSSIGPHVLYESLNSGPRHTCVPSPSGLPLPSLQFRKM